MVSTGIAARYQRQALVPEIGDVGQARLAGARVLCIGAGGLGCASLPYLAGAGVGRLTVVDDDRVERSNLQRQVLFGESDLGKPKAHAAAARLADLNPDIEIEGIETRLATGNVEALFRAHDLVLDGSDNYSTKFLCGDASFKFKVPLLYASATGMEAMVTLFDPGEGPCLRCLFPEPPSGWVPNCAEAGVLGPLVGMAGCIQATEAILWIATGQSALRGRLWWLDARSAGSRQLDLNKRADCRLCTLASDQVCLSEEARTGPEIDWQQARALDQAVWVDVREPDEFRSGHFPNACNVPLSELSKAEDIDLPPASRYVLYCQTGPRADRAAELLSSRGLDVYRLRGGMQAARSRADSEDST